MAKRPAALPWHSWRAIGRSGLLVLQEVQFARQDRALLGTFANQAALAVERAQLQDQAMRTRLLEEIDRWRGAMMGAVSHDLRTPLASVKAAVSSLRQDGTALERHATAPICSSSLSSNPIDWPAWSPTCST